jgi:integrase
MPKAKERDGVFQRKDRSGWWVSFVDASGKRRKQKVVAHTRTQALAALSTLKTREERSKFLGVRIASEIKTVDLFARYKRYQASRLRPSTKARLVAIVKTLLEHLPERAKDITKQTVAEVIAARMQAVSAGTIRKEVMVLKHALKLACEWDLLQTNPAQGAKLPRSPEGRTRYLSPTELKAVLESAPEWMKVPLALAAFTGMRRGELLSLRWTDVDLAHRRLYLRETKNGSLRILPLNDLAHRIFLTIPSKEIDGLVFPDVDAQKLSVYTRRLFEKLGIEDASFHSLRHTAASQLVMQGVDLYAVGQLLGHRTPRMTQRYAHLSPQYMAAAVGKLETAFGNVLDGASGTLALVPAESPVPKRTLRTSQKLLK